MGRIFTLISERNTIPVTNTEHDYASLVQDRLFVLRHRGIILLTDVGEYLVGAYLQLGEECDECKLICPLFLLCLKRDS